MKSLKKTLVLLVVFSMILSTLVPAFAFSDVEAGAVYEDQVTRMAALGIINGYAEDGTFRPDETVTRAQMVKIIGMMLGLDEGDAAGNKASTSKFSDVTADHWANGWINLASNKGIVNGYPDGTFRPDAPLTLNEVLTLCVKALGRGGYVDKMGAWPGNYLTEAARLNLKKDVEDSAVANRGTVAVIAWNTLNAATWYVRGENLDGEVSLGHDDKSLLAINFGEFATKAGNFKEIEGVKINDIVNDRQIELLAEDFVTVDGEDYFYDELAKKPSKNSDEKSYKFVDEVEVEEDVFEEVEKAIIYVPEEVCEDLDTIKNKTLTILFGEDHVAALIIVEDDLVDTAFLTKYDDNKVVVDGTSYKLAAGCDVEVNGYAGYKTLDAALNAIDADMNFKDIEKKIEATLTINENNKVSLIELKVSDNVANTVEVLVTKTNETSKKYTISTTGSNLTWELEAEEEKDFSFPTIYVDGEKGDIRDIEAGNVLTIIMDSNSDNDVAYNETAIAKIYVSTNTVTGSATRVKKSNDAITIDGEVYLRTGAGVKATKEELKKDLFNINPTSKAILDSDEVTLYLNIYGEYVAMSLTDAASDYTFGIVTHVSSNEAWEGEDEEILTRKIKVLTADAAKATTYTVTVDTSDEDIDAAAERFFDPEGNVVEAYEAEDFVAVENLPVEGQFIMFEADADKTIVMEKGTEIVELNKNSGPELAEDYILAKTFTAFDKDAEEFTATYQVTEGQSTVTKTIEAEYDSAETVIFNTVEKEIVKKWNAILNPGKTNFADNTFVIFADKDDEVPAYIVVAITDANYSTSDAQYAVVENSAYHEDADDKYYVDFVGDEMVEIKESVWAILNENTVNSFIEYKMASAKVSDAAILVDVDAFAELDIDDVIPGGIINDGFETVTLIADNRDVAIDAVVEAGAYTEEYADLFETADASAVLATYEFECVFPANAKDGDKYHIVQTNPALALAYPTSFANGIKTKTYEIGEDAEAGEELVVLVEDGKDVEVKVYVGETANEAKLIATYTITAPVVEEATEASEVEVIATQAGLVQENLKVAEVKDIYKDYTKLSFAKFEDKGYAVEELGSVKLDKDTVVYDLRNNGISTMKLSEFAEIDFDTEDIYAIPFRNADCDTDPSVEANILVIVDAD